MLKMNKMNKMCFSFCADSDETRAVLQGRQHGNNLVAVGAVGAAAAAADAATRVAGEQLYVGDERLGDDRRRFNVAEHAGVHERRRRRDEAATAGLDGDPERPVRGQQQARVRPDRHLWRQQRGQQQGGRSAPCATHPAHQAQGTRRLRRLRESPQSGLQESREEGFRIHPHGCRFVTRDLRREILLSRDSCMFTFIFYFYIYIYMCVYIILI